jgi:hypothetical protein
VFNCGSLYNYTLLAPILIPRGDIFAMKLQNLPYNWVGKSVLSLKNAVCWDVTPCSPCKNRPFEATYRLHHRGTRIGELGATLAITSNRSTQRRHRVLLSSVLRLLVTANVVPSSPILVILMMEAIRCFERSVLARATLRNIPEDGILHSHRREIHQSYIALTGWLCSGDVLCFLWGTNWVFISY